MLKSLAVLNSPQFGLTLHDLAAVTNLNPRRVKDQMAADIRDGNVIEDNTGYNLTNAGSFLLDRYEASRSARGLPLPPLTTPASESDEQDDEQDDGEDAAVAPMSDEEARDLAAEIASNEEKLTPEMLE